MKTHKETKKRFGAKRGKKIIGDITNDMISVQIGRSVGFDRKIDNANKLIYQTRQDFFQIVFDNHMRNFIRYHTSDIKQRKNWSSRIYKLIGKQMLRNYDFT